MEESEPINNFDKQIEDAKSGWSVEIINTKSQNKDDDKNE